MEYWLEISQSVNCNLVIYSVQIEAFVPVSKYLLKINIKDSRTISIASSAFIVEQVLNRL